MFHPLYNKPRTSGRYRSKRCGDRSTELQNLILNIRRARRICRPHYVVVIRLFIMLFTVVGLKPVIGHSEEDFWPFVSRLNVLSGTVASLLSVVYFDYKIFSCAVICAIFIKFMLDVCMHGHALLYQNMAWLSFHATAVMFSMLIGRRRSISKPLVFKASTKTEAYYIANLKHLRLTDVLEAGLRLQAALLVIDYSLSSKVGGTGCFFTLPFALLYAAGYSTGKNGTVVLGLLAVFAMMNDKSPLFGFSLVRTVSTIAGGMLGLTVGPGMLTMDEWLDAAGQLCY